MSKSSHPDKEQPPTLLSAGTKIIQGLIATELGVESPKAFNAVYRGIICLQLLCVCQLQVAVSAAYAWMLAER